MTVLRRLFICFLCLSLPVAPALAASVVDASPAAGKAAPAKKVPAKKPAAKPAPTAAAKRKAAAASKTRARKTADVVAAPLPKAKLDLSLPKDMVKNLEPSSKPATRAPVRDGLLPPLFSDKKGDDGFQLNGRLLSNEMQLQLRDDNRKQVEGAALDFEFKQ